MALPVLKLNLAPPPTLWRQYHVMIGWAVLATGAVALGAALFSTLLAYQQAAKAGKQVVNLTSSKQEALREQSAIQAQLESIDVEKELPRWRLAERILAERSLPWSRLAVELERSLVQDVRIRNIQRTRNSAQQVELKLKAEARNRQAQDAFIESLHKNPFFTEVILEREAENQGVIEFDCVLPASSTPPAYEPLPKFGPARASAAPPVPQAAPAKPAPARPAPPATRPQTPAASPAQPPRPVPPSRPAPARMAPGQAPGPATAPPPNYRPNMPMQPIQRQFPSGTPPQEGRR